MVKSVFAVSSPPNPGEGGVLDAPAQGPTTRVLTRVRHRYLRIPTIHPRSFDTVPGGLFLLDDVTGLRD